MMQKYKPSEDLHSLDDIDYDSAEEAGEKRRTSYKTNNKRFEGVRIGGASKSFFFKFIRQTSAAHLQ